jgi:hypothetical protein
MIMSQSCEEPVKACDGYMAHAAAKPDPPIGAVRRHRAVFRALMKAARGLREHESKDLLIFSAPGWHRGLDERRGGNFL